MNADKHLIKTSLTCFFNYILGGGGGGEEKRSISKVICRSFKQEDSSRFPPHLSTLKTFPKGTEIFMFTLEGGHEDSHAERKKLLPDHVISFTLLKLGYNKNKHFDYRGIGKDLSLTASVEKESKTKPKAFNRSFLRELRFQN